MRPRTSKPLVGILGDVDGRIVPVAPPPVSEFESGSSMPVRPSAVFELAPTGLDSNPDTNAGSAPDLTVFRVSDSMSDETTSVTRFTGCRTRHGGGTRRR